ncbi:MAG: polysaccharide pyruvyl transferase family protein [Clostridia bacterium]
MKKIGIVTHHKFYNQGTMLQAFALQQKLVDLKCDVQIINYTTEKHKIKLKDKILRIIKKPSLIYIKLLRQITSKINIKGKKDSIEAFDKFYNNIKLSGEKYTNVQEMLNNPPIYDIYIVGSDQTWNFNIPTNSPVYLLNFVPAGKTKCSYAPSVGSKIINSEHIKMFGKYLKDFKYISCRDISGKDILEKVVDKPIELVLDPTFLLTKEEWLKVSNKVNIKGEYVLLYFLGINKRNINIAKQIAKTLKMKVISIYNFDSLKIIEKDSAFGIGPSEFIYLVNNAKLICTDSFHGIAFSIIMNKQFYAFMKNKNNLKSDNNRIKEILEKFKLLDRLVTNKKDINYNNIDYNIVNEILSKEKEQSEQYLKKCIGEED